MEYSALKGKLIMPEYGRNVQKMVEHAVTIEDKEERTKCVNEIVEIMSNQFSYLRDVHDFKHKVWDHIAIMSNFQLDIDFPFEIIKKEELYKRPETVPYQNHSFKYKHYGRNLERMIEKASNLEEGEAKEEFIKDIANQMKKSYLLWNKDDVSDKKIFDDLRELSNGKLDVPENLFTLVSSKEVLYSARRVIIKNRKRQQS